MVSSSRTLVTLKRILFGVAVFCLAAEEAAAKQTLIGLSQTVQRNIFNPLVFAIISYALLLFLWGVYRYIAHAGDQKAAREGAKMMSYGLIILFVMVSVWGLVSILMETLGLPGAPVRSGGEVDFDPDRAFYQNVV